jgi:glycerol dehydrogenase
MAIYDDHHTLTTIDTLDRSPLLVLADTALIADAPPRFLVAGMGDAIAKKFEAERAFADGSGNFFDGHATLTGLAIADACYRTLRQHGAAALEAAKAHRTSPAFEAVVEANILMAGLAYETCGLSYAHAIVRGLSKARGAEAAIHGLQVAYATLVQLALEGRDDGFITELMGFYAKVELPTSLTALGMAARTDPEIAEIARLTGIGPVGGKIQVLKSVDQIAAAIWRVEALAAARP